MHGRNERALTYKYSQFHKMIGQYWGAGSAASGVQGQGPCWGELGLSPREADDIL